MSEEVNFVPRCSNEKVHRHQHLGNRRARASLSKSKVSGSAENVSYDPDAPPLQTRKQKAFRIGFFISGKAAQRYCFRPLTRKF